MTVPVEDSERVARAGSAPVVGRMRESAASACSPGSRGAWSRTQETLSSAGGPAAAPGRLSGAREAAPRLLVPRRAWSRPRGRALDGQTWSQDSNVSARRTHRNGLANPG